MLVFQVYSPGVFYMDENGEIDHESISLLHYLQTVYTEANLSLLLFEEARQRLREYMAAPSEQPRSSTPRAFIMRAPFMHAHDFVYSLDGFYSALVVLEKKSNTSDQFAVALNSLQAAFPTLRDIRNSAHHMEDRIRRKKTGEKPIIVQPIANDSFVTAGQAMVLDNLRGNKYGTTLASGHFAEIEVSADSMQKLQAIYQTLLNGLQWKDATQFPNSEPRPVIV